jgi:hypothetical protein
MTVGCVGALCECIEAAAIVAAAHSELVLLIIELYDDSRRFGVPEGIRQGLSRNAENLVCYVAMENIASSAALYQEINCPNRIEIRSHTISRNDHLVSSGERD